MFYSIFIITQCFRGLTILIEQHYYFFIGELPSKPVLSLYPVLIERFEVFRHLKAYPADSGSSICSRGADPARLALLRGLSRLMMSQ